MAVINCAKCGELLTPQQTSAPCPNCGSLDRIVLAVDQGVASEKVATALDLARKHYDLEDGLSQIFVIVSADEAGRSEPIKLLEVNEYTVESGIMPLHFGPAPSAGIPYSSIIIEVTPNEFQKIQSHELKLPEGWEIGEELPKPAANTGGV
jgi:hypothetical protein